MSEHALAFAVTYLCGGIWIGANSRTFVSAIAGGMAWGGTFWVLTKAAGF